MDKQKQEGESIPGDNLDRKQADDIKMDIGSLHSDEDGRNKEWEDRARVNLDTVPDGVRTNLERDFEPEQVDEKDSKKSRSSDPAY